MTALEMRFAATDTFINRDLTWELQGICGVYLNAGLWYEVGFAALRHHLVWQRPQGETISHA